MNVKSERKRGGTKTGIPDDKVKSRGGTTNEHVENPRRGGRGHERRTDMLLRKVGRDGVGGMTVSGINSGDIVEARDGGGIRDNRDGSDRSVITINVGGVICNSTFSRRIEEY